MQAHEQLGFQITDNDISRDSEKLLESAIESNLQMSYESRIEAHENARQLAVDLRQAGEELRAKSQSPS